MRQVSGYVKGRPHGNQARVAQMSRVPETLRSLVIPEEKPLSLLTHFHGFLALARVNTGGTPLLRRRISKGRAPGWLDSTLREAFRIDGGADHTHFVAGGDHFKAAAL